MKKLIFILLLLPQILFATGYYVKNGGNDGLDGKSHPNAWATISKVNSVSFAPGDQVLFQRGDTWNETLNIPSSGTSGNRITFGAYGTGADPVISAFTTISGWTNEGGWIYSKVISCESVPNIVLLDGVNTAKGRWPNGSTTWMIADSWSGSTGLYDAALPTSPDWDGATVVVRTAECLVDRGIISDHNTAAHTLTYSAITETPTVGNGYFIQNHIGTLDIYGEWCYTGGKLYMYFGSQSPTSHVVKISTRNNLVNISSKNYVTFDNIYFEGANVNGFNLATSDYITIQNCSIVNGGGTGINAGSSCDYAVIQNNLIENNNNAGILFSTYGSSNVSIVNNDINYSGFLIGMGQNAFDSYCGVINWGPYSLTTLNRIKYSGYCAIKYGGQNAEVSYNFIDYCNLCKDDGAGIYTWRCFYTNKVIKYNTILHSLARDDGFNYPEKSRGHGIYLDGAGETIMEYNTIAGCEGAGIFSNCNQNTIIRYNTIFDCVWSIHILSQLGELQRGLNAQNNILFAKSQDPVYESRQGCYELVAKNLGESEIPLMGIINNNWLAKPINSINYIIREYNAWGGTYNMYNLAQWQATGYGYELNGNVYPSSIPSTDYLHFIYNETSINKYYNLSAAMVDIKSANYSGQITLPPFSSLILIGAGTVIEAGFEISLPTVATSSISNIGYTTASGGGVVTSDGGASVTARGVCWSTSANPTTSHPKTNNGTGTGLFFSDITLLQMGTLYYVRAYATNSEGTAYGANQQFTTLAEEEPPPTSEGEIITFEGVKVTHTEKFVIK